MTPSQIRNRFRLGYNTHEIAAETGIPEPEICKMLERARAQERSNRQSKARKKAREHFTPILDSLKEIRGRA